MIIRKNKVFEYLFDVVVIFVGITISFYADNWKRSNEESQLEAEYLNGFLQDLKSDKEKLEMAMVSAGVVNASSIKLLGYIGRKEFQPDSFYFHSAQILEVIDFKPNMHTYEEIKSTSQLKLIKDDQLRKQIIDLYEFYKHLDFVDMLARKQQLEYYLPYITERIDQEAWGKVSDNISVVGDKVYEQDVRKLIGDVKFKNCLINVNTTFNQTQTHYLEGNQKCKDLLTKIQALVASNQE
ncbi:MAG: hypothetical protein ACJ75J_15495 [Cytophagaceae bacterium]